MSVDLVIQRGMRMRHIGISGLSGSTIFIHIISLDMGFERMSLNIKFVLIFSTKLSEIFLILRRTERDKIKNAYFSSLIIIIIIIIVLFFLIKLEISRQIFEKFKSTNFMKICRVGAQLSYADSQKHADSKITRLKVAFCNYAKAPKNENFFLNKFTFLL